MKKGGTRENLEPIIGDEPKRSDWRGSGSRRNRVMRTIALSLLALTLFATPAMAEQIEPASVRVIDGDTIAVDGRRSNIRLVGFNTPEIRNAKCEDEGRLGVNATNRLRELVQADPLELTIVRCACKPGTEGTRNCNYGRSCGLLKTNGQDVGEILIAEGLAVPFICGKTRCPKTPRPWCD